MAHSTLLQHLAGKLGAILKEKDKIRKRKAREKGSKLQEAKGSK